MSNKLGVAPLDPRDQSLIEEICFQLTGSRPDTLARLETCYVNLLRRMRLCNSDSLRDYLRLAQESNTEFSELLSALTIHTTSWFRERPHFEKLHARAKQHIEASRHLANPPAFRILSAACSSGEEVYTMALVLEPLRELHPSFDYVIEGWDIDPVSVNRAARAIYDLATKDQIPSEYYRHLRIGCERSAGLFTLVPSIRQRCHFKAQALDQPLGSTFDHHFQVIFCRNVLIYFKAQQVERIIHRLLRLLDLRGALLLGHSESIEAAKFGLKSLGNAAYVFESSTARSEVFELERGRGEAKTSKKKVLVLDDSPIAKMAVRRALESKGLAVHFTSSFVEASSQLRAMKFDLLLIDLRLARVDQGRWIDEHKRKESFSSVLVMDDGSGTDAKVALFALEQGALECIDKRLILSDPQQVAAQIIKFLAKPHLHSTPSGPRARPQLRPPQLIVIGASTGGTEALLRLLKDMPRPCPPVLVVQHIATSFAKSFAERLTQVSGLRLGLPQAGSQVKPDHLYMAWDDYHIGIKSRGGILQLETSVSPPQHSVRPAVDFLFESSAQLSIAESTIAVLLTGMGKDGAQGLLRLKYAGAMTFTQDEASSVVYGMPGEAFALGASAFSGSPEQIRRHINEALALDRSPKQPSHDEASRSLSKK